MLGSGVVHDGIRILGLASLIELKLASGMTNPLRGQDLVDVQNLIVLRSLPESFAEMLNPFVQPKYREIWTMIHNAPADPQE